VVFLERGKKRGSAPINSRGERRVSRAKFKEKKIGEGANGTGRGRISSGSVEFLGGVVLLPKARVALFWLISLGGE